MFPCFVTFYGISWIDPPHASRRMHCPLVLDGATMYLSVGQLESGVVRGGPDLGATASLELGMTVPYDLDRVKRPHQAPN